MNVATKAATNSPLRLWAIRLLVVGVAALVVGFGVYFGAAALSPDPCLDDWDIACTSTSGDRLSLVQGLMLPVMFVGYWSLIGSAVLGLALLAKTGARHLQTRKFAGVE